jgi:hypothetical protein
MKKLIVIIAGVIAVVYMCAPHAHAQNIYGFASLDFDENSGGLFADCETDADYDATYYYDVGVTCEIWDDNETLIGTDEEESMSNESWIASYVSGSPVPDVGYTARATHWAHIFFFGVNMFDDYYNLGYWEYQGIDSPNYYDFFLPGPPQTSPSQRRTAGRTNKYVKPERPGIVRGYYWCASESLTQGASVIYDLRYTVDGPVSNIGWYVIEHQTDTSLATSEFGPGTSWNIDRFDDHIFDAFAVHDSVQTFTIASRIGGPQYPVGIEWFGGGERSSNTIVINPGDIVLINGQQTPDQSHCIHSNH